VVAGQGANPGREGAAASPGETGRALEGGMRSGSPSKDDLGFVRKGGR